MLKGFMDGSLGSHTAAMKAPFADEPNNSGLARYDQANLNTMAVERAEAGFQLGFHAIGDRAASMALDAFSQTYDACPELAPQDKNPYKVPRCWPTVAQGHRDRIEHAQVVDSADIPRFAKLGVIASMQPNHLLTDMNWALDRLGPQRAAYSYARHAISRTLRRSHSRQRSRNQNILSKRCTHAQPGNLRLHPRLRIR